MNRFLSLRARILVTQFFLVTIATPCVVADEAAESAIRQIETLNGHVTRRPDGTVSHIYGSRKFRDHDLVHCTAFSDVRFVYLESSTVTDDGLKRLSNLSHLEEVTLPPQITDAGLVHLTGIRLKYLDLPSRITDAGMVHVAAMSSLTRLKLSPRITDEGLDKVAQLDALTSLDLGSSRVTNDGLRNISRFKKLLAFDFSDAPNVTADAVRHLQSLPNMQIIRGTPNVTDRTLQLLASIPNLSYLDISDDPQVTDDALRHLERLKRLQYVHLGPGITDAGMVHVGKIRGLITVDLRNTRITGKGLRELWASVSGRLFLPSTVGDKGLWQLADFKLPIETLYLEGETYTDEAIPRIANVRGLTVLRLRNTKISENGTKLMKKLKPNVLILFR